MAPDMSWTITFVRTSENQEKNLENGLVHHFDLSRDAHRHMLKIPAREKSSS